MHRTKLTARTLVRGAAWLVIGAAIPLQATALGLIALGTALLGMVVIIVTGGPRLPGLRVVAIGAALAVLTIGCFAAFGGTGFDPVPWFVVGVALLVLGAGANGRKRPTER